MWKWRCKKGKVSSDMANMDPEWIIEQKNDWYRGPNPKMKVGEQVNIHTRCLSKEQEVI